MRGSIAGLLCCFAFLAGCMVSQLEVARHITPSTPYGMPTACLPPISQPANSCKLWLSIDVQLSSSRPLYPRAWFWCGLDDYAIVRSERGVLRVWAQTMRRVWVYSPRGGVGVRVRRHLRGAGVNHHRAAEPRGGGRGRPTRTSGSRGGHTRPIGEYPGALGALTAALDANSFHGHTHQGWNVGFEWRFSGAMPPVGCGWCASRWQRKRRGAV
jgi:hypothetical protein